MLVKDRDNSNKVNSGDPAILSNPKYICLSSAIITNSLKNGSDVMQLPNGDIIVTEYKAVTVHYKWDEEKKKMRKIQKTV